MIVSFFHVLAEIDAVFLFVLRQARDSRQVLVDPVDQLVNVRSTIPTGLQVRPHFVPGPFDVICARGKRAYNHEGNERFREHVKLYASRYAALTTKLERTLLLSEIVEWVKEKGSGFIKVDRETGVWYEVSDLLAREKVGQQVRESLSKQYKSSFEKKKERRNLTYIQRSENAYQLLVSDSTICKAMDSFQEQVGEQTRKLQETEEVDEVTYQEFCNSTAAKKKKQEDDDAEMLKLFTSNNEQILELLKSRGNHLVQQFHEKNSC